MSGSTAPFKLFPDQVEVIVETRLPLDAALAEIERDMKRAVRVIPAWIEWGKSVRGLGELGFAVICAEALVRRLQREFGIAVPHKYEVRNG